jgi:hypothetical protein
MWVQVFQHQEQIQQINPFRICSCTRIQFNGLLWQLSGRFRNGSSGKVSIFDRKEFWGYSTNARHEWMLFCFTHLDSVTIHHIVSLSNESLSAFRAYSLTRTFQTAVQERFFIIKSWNMQNVVEAQRNGIWATQEKNTRLFTEAFRDCRSVVLLFSVNKSMAFQGAVSNYLFT